MLKIEIDPLNNPRWVWAGIAMVAAGILIGFATGCAGVVGTVTRSPDGTWSASLRDGGAVVGVQVAHQASGEATAGELGPLFQAWAKALKSGSDEDWAEVWRLGRVIIANARARANAARRGKMDVIYNADEADPWSD